MPFIAQPQPQHKPTPSTCTTITIENNIAYPFRLRHSYGQTPDFHATCASTTPVPRPGSKRYVSSDVRPDSAVLSGPQFAHASTLSIEEELGLDDEDGDTVPRFPAAAHLSHRASARFSYASRSSSSRHLPPSPMSADFPIIPSRPPLRPTVSFGGVSQMSYYSTYFCPDDGERDQELEARSVSLARAEEESVREARTWKAKTESLSGFSVRKARSLACMWPEARRKPRRKGW